MRIPSVRLAVATSLLSLSAFSSNTYSQEDSTKPSATAQEVAAADKAEDSSKWEKLIPGDSLDGWEKTNFGGEGEVTYKEGVIKLDFGNPLTGIHTKNKDFPKNNYEMRWKARRVKGSDFFAGVTFPIGDEFCSFICGGWGGGLVGISSINGNDASENSSATFHNFKNEEWYSFRVRVESDSLKVWIGDEEVVNVEREGKRFSVRPEVRDSRPLGYCVFQSVVEIKDWEFKKLD